MVPHISAMVCVCSQFIGWHGTRAAEHGSKQASKQNKQVLGVSMLQAFDFETGLPKRCVKMESWPIMDRLSRPFWEHLGRAAVESFVPTKTTEGLLVMFDRCTPPFDHYSPR